jgi:hypothetical protein
MSPNLEPYDADNAHDVNAPSKKDFFDQFLTPSVSECLTKVTDIHQDILEVGTECPYHRREIEAWGWAMDRHEHLDKMSDAMKVLREAVSEDLGDGWDIAAQHLQAETESKMDHALQERSNLRSWPYTTSEQMAMDRTLRMKVGMCVAVLDGLSAARQPASVRSKGRKSLTAKAPPWTSPSVWDEAMSKMESSLQSRQAVRKSEDGDVDSEAYHTEGAKLLAYTIILESLLRSRIGEIKRLRRRTEGKISRGGDSPSVWYSFAADPISRDAELKTTGDEWQEGNEPNTEETTADDGEVPSADDDGLSATETDITVPEIVVTCENNDEDAARGTAAM